MKKSILQEIKTMQKFMLYDWGKTDSENTHIFEQIIGTPPDSGTSSGSGSGSGKGSGGSGSRPSAPAIQIPSELKDVEGVKKFQDWLDENRPGWATGYTDGKVNKGRGYGRFGPRTSKAWNEHKEAFLNPVEAALIPGNEIVNVEPSNVPSETSTSSDVVGGSEQPAQVDVSQGL